MCAILTMLVSRRLTLASSLSKGLVNDLGPGSVGSANVLSAIIGQEDLETKQNSTSVVSQENNWSRI